MTPQMSALVWRAMTRSAATYTKYLNADPETSRLWGQFYNVTDLAAWSRERIGELLDRSREHYDAFSGDAALLATSKEAARESIMALESAGFAVDGG